MTAVFDGPIGTRSRLDGIPDIDLAANLQAAVQGGKRHWQILREVMALRRGPGKLTPQEYFYYRLWDPGLSGEAKKCFVGKQAQEPMHRACNELAWFSAAADKLLFQTIMTGSGLPVPRLLTVIGQERGLPGIPVIDDRSAIAPLLRREDLYPAFAKPIDGIYSLGVLRLDRLDPSGDRVLTSDGPLSVARCAERLGAHPAGYLVQQLLRPQKDIAALTGSRLCSVRFLVLLTPDGPLIHRAAVKIPTGDNVADNYWRRGNLLGAVDEQGVIRRVVRGSGRDLEIVEAHPDTKMQLHSAALPDWSRARDLCIEAALTLPGIRTQSWDVTLTDEGPVLLEVNWGGDLNLHQLAWGQGVLDEPFRAHLRRRCYRF